jgi:hypothetical protein
MIQTAETFTTQERTLIISSGKQITFDYPIDTAVGFDTVIVVMLEPNKLLNENVFGVSYDGKIMWQVDKRDHVYDESPYTYIGRKDNNVELGNFDGLELIVEPATGKILHQQWGK